MRDASLGVYVHVPFCERVCPYCDFAVVAARPLRREHEDRYVRALLTELGRRTSRFRGHRLETLYFGGGTPSLLHPESIARLRTAIGDAFPGEACEVTLELNPSTVERERLAAFREAGVNRLSVGVQSFDDDTLRRLGRAHRASEAELTLVAARTAGFENVSIDLLFAAPAQGLAGLRRDLERALAFGPTHVSTYSLSVEEGTPFATAHARGQLKLPDDDTAARMMTELRRGLAAAGLPAYEISSHARPGFESRHNRRYWRRLPVLGLGMGAWSAEPASATALHGARRANEASLEAYLGRVEGSGREPIAEVLDPETARGEAMFLGLRTARGVRAAEFAAEFGCPPKAFFGAAIDELLGFGLLRAEEDDLRLTARGVLLADSVFARFVGGPSGAASVDARGVEWYS